MTRFRSLRTLAALVCVLVVSGCAATPARGAEPVRALKGTDFSGTQWDLAKLRGQVVLVAVWASWCGPCHQEVQPLSRAQRDLGPEGLVVLGVNFRDNPDAAESFLAEEKPSYPSIPDADGSMSVDWGVTAIPQSFLVSRDGKIVERHMGEVTEAWVDDVVAAEVAR